MDQVCTSSVASRSTQKSSHNVIVSSASETHAWAGFALLKLRQRKQSDPHQTFEWKRGIKINAVTVKSIDYSCYRAGFFSSMSTSINTSCCSLHRQEAFKSPGGFTKPPFNQLKEKSSLIQRLEEERWVTKRLDPSLSFINCTTSLAGGNQWREEETSSTLHFPSVSAASSLNTNCSFSIFALIFHKHHF